MRFPQHYQAFLERLTRRLIKGHETYGDESFERNPEELLDELQQEAMDLAGWGYVLYAKIEGMKARAKKR